MSSRARLPGQVAPGTPARDGPGLFTPSPMLRRRTAEPAIRRVREAPEDDVRVRWRPRARGVEAAAATSSTPSPTPAVERAVVAELFRLSPTDLLQDSSPVPRGARGSLLIYNPISAPLYLKFGPSPPTPGNHDIACPGSAVMTVPIDETVTQITALVDYAGAPPPTDVADAVIRASSDRSPLSISPLT